LRTTIACALAALALAGCGKPINTTPMAEPSAKAPTASAAVAVAVKEWSIAPSPAAVKAGSVTLTIRNEGKEPHGIYVEGPGVDRKGPLVQPGQTQTLTLELTAGSYNLFDFVKDNESAHAMTAALKAE
jgi:iron uptake system EfeUOB component EfeO/EfeM